MTLPNNNRQPGIIQTRIPDLPFADPLTGTELLWLTQLGRSKKVFVSSFSALVAGEIWVFVSSNTAGVAGTRYATDTRAAPFTLTLPALPTIGSALEVSDAYGNWQTNNLTVAQGGNTIEGLAQNMVMDLNRARVVFAFDGTTWRVFG